MGNQNIGPEFFWLALNRLYGVGPVTAHKLLKAFKNPEALFSAEAQRLREAGVKSPLANQIQSLHNPSSTLSVGISKDLQWLSHPRRNALSQDDPRFPPLLKQSRGAPLCLFVDGDIDCLSQPQIAMVGTRNPTPSGAETAAWFAQQLSKQGFVVTSGLALGVDTAAHKGALNGGGFTIAVMGTGPDQIYPNRNTKLAHQIGQKGALLSEFPVGTPTKSKNFPKRNRIIAGMSLGVLVVEAAMKSGSLITARLAGEEGREVFALPGSVHSPVSKGCHHLIRQGAKLVESAEDIIEELGYLAQSHASGLMKNNRIDISDLEPDVCTVLDALEDHAIAVDQVVARTELRTDQVMAHLMLLELKGLAHNQAGGYVRSASVSGIA